MLNNLINCIINSNPYLIWKKFKEIAKAYDVYATLCLKYANTQFIIAPSGSGDVYIISRFIRQYLCMIREKWENRNLRFVVTGNNGKCITDMYGINPYAVINAKENLLLIKLWMYGWNIKLRGIILHWGMMIQHISVLRALEGMHNYNMYSMFKYAVFGGIKEIKYYPNIKIDDNYIDSIFKKFSLKPGKTVLLIPYSSSLKYLPNLNFWKSLTSELIQRGFCVCTNVVSKMETEIPGTQPLAVRLDQINFFLEKAGSMISVRTGLADITIDAKCKRIVLYPDRPSGRTDITDYHGVFSINQMYQIDNDIEVLYDLRHMNNVKNKIMMEFGEKNEYFSNSKCGCN